MKYQLANLRDWRGDWHDRSALVLPTSDQHNLNAHFTRRPWQKNTTRLIDWLAEEIWKLHRSDPKYMYQTHAYVEFGMFGKSSEDPKTNWDAIEH